MGKIDLPVTQTKSTEEGKSTTDIADTFPQKVEADFNESEKDILVEKAVELNKYRAYLDVEPVREEMEYLGKTIKILEENGHISQKEKIAEIKKIQYKLGTKNIKHVFEYLRIEGQIGNLVSLQKSL